MSLIGTKLPIRDVRSSAAIGGRPDMMRTAEIDHPSATLAASSQAAANEAAGTRR